MVAFRAHGIQHGSMPSFDGRGPHLSNRGTIQVGDRFATRAHQTRPALATGPAGSLVIGDRVFVNQGAVIHADESIVIGSHVLVGDGVAICDTDFHEVDPGGGVTRSAVVVGDHVWLARSVLVLPGARIGEGTVVAAGAVVRGELPPWVVAAGSPARPVRDITSRGTRR